MTYIPLLVVTLAFVAVTGFSLQDSLSSLNPMPDKTPVEYRPGYPRTLQRELEGHLGSFTGSRVSRSALRKAMKYTSCCGSAEYYGFSDEIVTKYPECHPENMHGGETGDQISGTIDLCLINQCHAKKTGVVDGEGYVLKDAFVNAVSNWYTEDSLKTLAKTLAPNCVAESNAYAKEVLAASDRVERCNEASHLAKTCIDIFVIVECPEDLKINNDDCDMMRGHVERHAQDWKNSTLNN